MGSTTTLEHRNTLKWELQTTSLVPAAWLVTPLHTMARFIICMSCLATTVSWGLVPTTRRAFGAAVGGTLVVGPAVAIADDGVPMDLGPLGMRKEGASGKLNTCPPQGIKRGCISTSAKESQDLYVPPWVYQAEDSGAVVTELSKMKAQDVKTIETAVDELVRAIEAQPGAKVVDKGQKADGRYVRAEFSVPGNFGGSQTDDLEFLLAKPGTSDPPFLVDYHSVSRPGNGDDVKRHRERIKAIRLELVPAGWKSVGRLML